MNILKLNTSPSFQIVPRRKLTSQNLTIELVKEGSQTSQTINATATLLPNENYTLLLASFPNGKVNDKFSFTILESTEIVCLGKLMIVSQTEIIQDYAKKTTSKYYR